MKVLQITVHFAPNIGGVETHLWDLVRGLAKQNINVQVLTYRPLVANTGWEFVETGKNYNIIRLPWVRGLFYTFKHPVLQFLYLFPGLFAVTPFIILLSNPDVIHAHGIVSGFIGTFWGKAFGKKVIISTHSLYQFPDKGLYRNIVRETFRRADKVLTLSKQSKQEILNLGVNEKKVEVFTYWVDLKKFTPSDSTPSLLLRGKQKAKIKVGWKDKFVVMFVGRLVEEKGVPELLVAAKKWDRNITLAIAGSGPMEEVINKQKSTNNNVIFLGRVGQDELPKYYSAADLVIVPSTHEEGFGRVILESLACGTPVIGSNRGAIPEAMDETVGKLIKVTPENIKKTVEYFYKDRRELVRLSKNARTYAEKKYSEKNMGTITTSYK